MMFQLISTVHGEKEKKMELPKYFYFRVRVIGIGEVELEDASDADVVEVVRCKDCKWYKRKYPWNGNIYECTYLDAPMDDDGFCSWGERREDER